jgi:hypothetical protein
VVGAEFKDTTEEEPDASGARTVSVRFSDVMLVASRVKTWKTTRTTIKVRHEAQQNLKKDQNNLHGKLRNSSTRDRIS